MRWLLGAGLATALACAAGRATGQDDGAAPPRAAGTLALREVTRMALRASPEDRVAVAQMARAEAESDAASAAYLPRADVGVRAAGQIERGNLLLRQETYVVHGGFAEARAGVRWQLHDFGRTAAIGAAADASRAAAQHGRDAARVAVVQRVAAAYFTVLFDEQVVVSRRTAVKQRGRFAAIAKGLVGQGVRPALDEARAKVNLEAAQHDLTVAETRLAIDRARLAVQIGLAPDRLPALASVSLPTNVDEEAARAAASSERERPEVHQAGAEVEAEEHRVAASRAAYLPRVDLDAGGAYRLSRFDYADTLIPRADVSAGITVTVPLFDATLGARVDASRAEQAAAQGRDEAAHRRARLEGYEAAVSLRAARALELRARALESAAVTALAVTEGRYASGLATALEVVDAEESDAEAREGRLAAELRVQIATVGVMVAMGKVDGIAGGT